MMKYTSRDYLNRMIAVAIENGTITASDVHRLIDVHGGNDEAAMVDILSMIWQRKKDKELLESAQVVYKNYRSDKQGDFDK